MKSNRPLRFWFPYLVLAIALLATAVASLATVAASDEKDRLHFEGLIQRLQNNIGHRLDIYIALLRSGRALFTAESTVDAAAFGSFVNALHLPKNYHGIQGIGYLAKVAPEQVVPLTREMERQGIEGFHIRPAGSRGIYFPVLYLEPGDSLNRAVPGFDMSSEPLQWEAMARARDRGRPAATCRLPLLPGEMGGELFGFLLYLPVYEGGDIPSGIEERRRRLTGFLYAPFRSNDLLAGVHNDQDGRLVDVDIYDGATPHPGDLLYSSRDGAPADGDSHLIASRLLDMQGRTWTLRFFTRPGGDARSGVDMVPYIVIGGLLISLLLFAVTRSQLRALQSTERIALDLRRSEERYRTIVDTAPDVIYTIAADGSITSLSPAFELLTRWSPEEWIGQPFAPLVDPDDLLLAMAAFMAVLRGESPPNYELRIRAKSGGQLLGEFRSRPQFENGAIIGAIGIARDITDRRRADEALRQSEERYRAFVEKSTEAIWRFEMEKPLPIGMPEDEQIEHFYRHAYLAECNVVMARMYGYERPEDIAGARLGDLLISSRPENIDYLRSFIRSGYRLDDAISEETDLQGSRVYFASNLAGVIEEGMLVRAWGTQRDITERRRAEQERERLLVLERRARAEAQAASSAKDRFLAILSHELRTPLTPVMVAMEFLNNDAPFPEQIRGMLEIINRNVHLEARLIDDLLDLTGIVNGKMQLRPENVDAHALLQAAADVARPEIDTKRLDLRFELEARHHHVFADPARLQQVFWNLIKNAVKFTPEGGRITVSSGNLEHRIRVQIRDTGIGIEPAVLERIFNPFEQGEQTITRRFGGLGLGLAIGKMLVEMHGGELRVSSDGAGTGATFTIELGVADDHIADQSDAPGERSPDDRRRSSILYVEDHEDTASVIRMLLEQRGYPVTAVADVAGALRMAEGRYFDLLISDIGLPDGTGLELMRELRRRHSVGRGIAISGFGSKEDVARSLAAGFAEHLTKPLNFHQLEEAINRQMGSGGDEKLRRDPGSK